MSWNQDLHTASLPCVALAVCTLGCSVVLPLGSEYTFESRNDGGTDAEVPDAEPPFDASPRDAGDRDSGTIDDAGPTRDASTAVPAALLA